MPDTFEPGDRVKYRPRSGMTSRYGVVIRGLDGGYLVNSETRPAGTGQGIETSRMQRASNQNTTVANIIRTHYGLPTTGGGGFAQFLQDHEFTHVQENAFNFPSNTPAVEVTGITS